MEQSLDIGKYIEGVRRRLWIVALIFIPGALLATAVAYVLPPRYESTARILVESQKIPAALAQSTVTVSAAERLQLIQQRVLARENVLDVIERLNLFADQPDLTPTDKVDAVRAATNIQMISYNTTTAPRGQPAMIAAFTITYSAKDAQTAARVANELVTRVLELNLQGRSEQVQETHNFFSQEVERLAADLIALESEIANFKQQNEHALPTTLASRQGALQGIEGQLFAIGQQRTQLQEQLRAMREALQTLIAMPSPPMNLRPEEQQLSALRTQLAREESLLTDQNPTIRQLKSEITALERIVASLPGGGASPAALKAQQVEQARAQITSVETQLELLNEQEAREVKRKAELEASIADTPRVEASLNTLQRRLGDLQTRYQIALSRQAQAATGEKLELDQKAERFEVIEQARVSPEPVAPKRMVIAAGGAAASLIIGLGVALLLELLSKAVRTGSDLQRTVQLRPIATIPYIFTPAERQIRRFAQVSVVVLFCVVLPSSIWLVDQYVMPIELVSDWVLDRTGLERVWQDIRPRVI